MTVLAGLAGGLAIAGIALLLLELTRRASPPGTPRRRVTIGRQARRRLLIAFAAGLVTLAITHWPVAMIAAVLAVLYLPRITSSRAAQRRAAMLEGLEQWTRRLSDMLTASRGLEDALEASARQAPTAIEPAVTALGRRLAARVAAETALRAFAADIGDPAGDRIAAALIIATGHRGGAVRDVLNSLAVMLARDVAARREIEADRAQHRITVKWLTLFVLGVHGLRDAQQNVLRAVRDGTRSDRDGGGGRLVRRRARLVAPSGLGTRTRQVPRARRTSSDLARRRSGGGQTGGRTTAAAMSAWLVVAGLLTGLGGWLVVSEVIPAGPSLRAAIDRLESGAGRADDQATLRVRVGHRLAAAAPWLPMPATDLRLLGQDPAEWLAIKVSYGVLGLAVVPTLATLLVFDRRFAAVDGSGWSNPRLRSRPVLLA